MVATPDHIPGENRDALVARLAALENTVRALGNKTLHSVSVVSAAGTKLFSIVPSGFVDADGNPLVSLTMNDPIAGTAILTQAPATTVANNDGTTTGTDWFWHMDDTSGNQVVATDGKTGKGLAFPYISVPMYPQWNDEHQPSAPGTAGYRTVAASAISSAQLMWEGRIGFGSHPVLSVDGVWGRSTGSGTETTTYTLKVNGSTVSTVDGDDSFTATGIEVTKHRFDVSDFVGKLDSGVQLFAQSSLSNTDRIACQVLGVWLRQSP